MEMMLVLCFSFLQIFSYASSQGMNVAYNQAASQLQTLDWNNFNWTADKVVDNCTSQDNPDEQQCCSASVGTTDNFIRVDFDKPYNISSIVVYGRVDTEVQTKNFRLSIVTVSGDLITIYDNVCCEYGNGIFTIPVNDSTVSAIIATRPTESILTLCEIQAFETIPATEAPTTAQTTTGQGQTTSISQGQTTSSGQGQTTSSGQGQTTSSGPGQATSSNQSQSTTSTTTQASNSVPRWRISNDVIMLLALNALLVWNTL